MSCYNKQVPVTRTALTIELVPATSWFDNLRKRLSTADWDRLRKAQYKHAGYKCEICGGKGPAHPVEAHEVWIYDDAKMVQKLAGLIALCPGCHEVKHFGFANIQGRSAEAKAHLMWANSWRQEEAERYITEVTAQWEQRSRKNWTLDLSWLETQDVSVPPVSA